MITRILTTMGTVAILAQAAWATDGFKAPDLEAADFVNYMIAAASIALLCVVCFKNAKRQQQN